MRTAAARLSTALQFLDASSEPLAVKDVAGRFVGANRAFAAVVRVDRDRVSGACNEDFFGSEAGSDVSLCEHLAMLAQEPVERDVRVSLGGEPAVVHVVCTPWFEASACAGVVLSCTVVETHHTAQDSVALQNFASDVGTLAHRFNNALTTVLGLADWHLVTGSHEEPLRIDLEKIRSAAGQAELTAREIQRLTKDTAAQLLRPVPRSIDTGDAGQSPTANVLGTVPPAPARTTVLLVDDEPEVRTSLAVMLRTLGYDVQAVEGGEAALAWMTQARPSLVITDLGMPGMDGNALASAVRCRWPDVPIVLLTGWATVTDAVPDGIRALLSKPLRMAQLRQCLREIVGAPHAA
jgi:CheY-like chemotaxis protein